MSHTRYTLHIAYFEFLAFGAESLLKNTHPHFWKIEDVVFPGSRCGGHASGWALRMYCSRQLSRQLSQQQRTVVVVALSPRGSEAAEAVGALTSIIYIAAEMQIPEVLEEQQNQNWAF